MVTKIKQAPKRKKLRTAGFTNPNALKLDIPTPPTVRECLAQGLFGSGISPRGYREMSVEHSKQLIERHPSLYRLADASPVPSSPPFAREGFACGDGWFEIVGRLSARLSADPNLVVGQLKEKFGLLRISFEMSPLPPSEIEEGTDIALAEAVAESQITCERCGKPGKHAQREGRWSVKCDACTAEEARRKSLRPWMERLLAGLPAPRKVPWPLSRGMDCADEPGEPIRHRRIRDRRRVVPHRRPHLGEAGQRHGLPGRPGQRKIRPSEGVLRES
jgi:hypothetical protein